MKRILILLSCAAALLLGACGKDSSLPSATGKASVRAINAIKTSQEFNFLIEQRLISSVAYTSVSSPARYDDLDYTFNIEVFYPGETGFRRIASRFIDFEANKDYTLLVSGSLASPTLTLWEDDERAFDAADTVFEAKFAHTAESLGALDYYFADPTIVPALGSQAATLSFGEISPPVDFEAGDFVLTITTAGNPGDVVFVSDTSALSAQATYIITPFDGDAGDTAPVLVRAINTSGNSLALPDSRFPPTIEFVNASLGLGASDIYDDEMLTSRIVTNLDYPEVSTEMELPVDAVTFYFTPTGDTTAVTLERSLAAFGGGRYRIIATGPAGNIFAVATAPNRRSVETQAKLLVFQGSSNFDFIDFYAVAAGTSIDDANPTRFALATRQVSEPLRLAAGSYDLYATEFAEKVPLAGPYQIDVALGDVVDMIIVDTEDPSVLDVLFLSGGPTP